MSNDRPPQAASAQPRPVDRQAVPVARLKFFHPTDLPGKSAASALTASERWSIEFRPWHRCFHVTWNSPDGPPEEDNIMEHRVASWR